MPGKGLLDPGPGTRDILGMKQWLTAPRPRLALALMALMACTPRGTITVVPPDTVPGPIVPLFVGTTRQLDVGGVYGPERSETLNLARYDIAIPPARQLGKVVFPKRPTRPDPQTDFLTTAQVFYPTEARFRTDLSRSLSENGREAVIFVHGFNNTFTDGLYRIAQLHHDLDVPGVAVHYSWPSAAEPLGYVYDKDSVMFARKGLETLIRETIAAGATRVVLVAHSMGSFLTMEALRDIALADGAIMPQIAGVALMSPDIDVEVFRMQAKEIGKLPQPFIIFGSDRDRVLRLSALITGQRGRLGSLDSVADVADLEVTYVDVAAFSTGDGHFVTGTSPALIRLLGRINEVDQAFGADAAGRSGLLPGVILTVQNATRIILTPVAEITGNSLN